MSDNLIGQMAQNAHDLATNWRAGLEGPISADANEAITLVQRHVSQAVAAIGAGMTKAEQARNNLDIHPEGRKA